MLCLWTSDAVFSVCATRTRGPRMSACPENRIKALSGMASPGPPGFVARRFPRKYKGTVASVPVTARLGHKCEGTGLGDRWPSAGSRRRKRKSREASAGSPVDTGPLLLSPPAPGLPASWLWGHRPPVLAEFVTVQNPRGMLISPARGRMFRSPPPVLPQSL